MWISIALRVARHARKVVFANPHLPFPPVTICGYRLAATTSDNALPLCCSVAFAILTEFHVEGLQCCATRRHSLLVGTHRDHVTRSSSECGCEYGVVAPEGTRRGQVIMINISAISHAAKLFRTKRIHASQRCAAVGWPMDTYRRTGSCLPGSGEPAAVRDRH
jgi:hypothetical protein